ncbi:DUF58 domain-containing protein [Parenemella sanctibonifatiensis]|uniref:DUF58 domain-containing protein n=1 Tax=Parenemella sanctibonifatiensis TaxID=2016505 RepID=A0A255ERR5_9ACTN|nr:DUF58 domain-containing protein [Parenemella sanctibonifatiensis]OYN90823.1 DUF58 domain-containing protein [Parenemella sanctibonifatiensis]
MTSFPPPSGAPAFPPPQGPPAGAPVAPAPAAAAASIVGEPTEPTIPLNELAPEAALRRLELTVVRRLEGFLHGDHLGLLPGPGADTNDAREYQPGQDDVRRMDWAVTARTTVPHVRDTMADRELETWALLDVTPSMNWGTEGVTKRDLGIAAIATIGFLSQRMGDRFGGFIMRSDGVRRLPGNSGRTALYGLLRTMLTEPIVPDHAPGGVELAAGIETVSRTQRRRGMRVVVSDFLEPGSAELDPNVPPSWERPMRRLAVRNQVLAIEVVDRRELEFPDVGDLLIRDPETSFERYVNTSDAHARRQMNAASQAQRERIKLSLRRAGVGHIQLRTDRDWVQDIARFVLGYRRVASMLHAPPKGVSR